MIWFDLIWLFCFVLDCVYCDVIMIVIVCYYCYFYCLCCVACVVFVLFLCCFVLFVLFCFVLFCFVLFCFVLFCFVLFCFVFVLQYIQQRIDTFDTGNIRCWQCSESKQIRIVSGMVGLHNCNGGMWCYKTMWCRVLSTLLCAIRWMLQGRLVINLSMHSQQTCECIIIK